MELTGENIYIVYHSKKYKQWLRKNNYSLAFQIPCSLKRFNVDTVTNIIIDSEFINLINITNKTDKVKDIKIKYVSKFKIKLINDVKFLQYKEEKYLLINHNGIWSDNNIEIFKIENIIENDINKIKLLISI